MITTVNGSAGEELLEELRDKKSEAEKRLAKEDAKRWVPIEAALSLAEALRRLSKQELTDIRVSLAVTGASSLNKSQLADKLAEELPSRLGTLLERMDEEQYRIVKSAADRGGVLPDPGNRYETAYFQRLGLLYPGTIDGARVVVMPAEVREAFKAGDSAALRKSVRDRSQLVRLATGALYYYGALSAGKLAELLAPHLGGALDEGELRDILAGREEFAGGLQQGDYGFADDAALEPEGIVREHESRPELPYYPFSKEQLLEAGSLDFIDRNLSYRTFANFLAVHYEMEKDEIDEVLQDLVFNIRNGDSPSELMESLQDGFEMDAEGAAQSFIAHLTALFNHTRMWALKGYSPNELAEAARREAGAGEGASGAGSAIVPAPARKIGRNEPCPCGSGKKYKKCCAG